MGDTHSDAVTEDLLGGIQGVFKDMVPPPQVTDIGDSTSRFVDMNDISLNHPVAVHSCTHTMKLHSDQH